MSVSKYLKSCTGIYHTTLDPKGVGVLRIHLIPPKKLKLHIPWVVILNGYYVLPLQSGWAVLLKEFIEAVNKDADKDFEEFKEYVLKAAIATRKIFKKATQSMLKHDLNEMISTFKDLVYNKEVNSEIGLMTFKEYSKFMKAPHRMDLMISSMEKNGCWNCNQKCLHCYASGEKMSNVNELSTDEWKLIIDKCKEAGIPQLTFTGGEPTIRKDLVELVDYAKWFITRLNTNGILVTKELANALYNASLDSIQFTFYSSDKDIHNQLVGGDHFDKTVLGIKNAIEAGLDVSVNTPLCSLNKDYVPTIAFLEKLGVKYFSTSGLIPTGNAKEEDSVMTRLSEEEITWSVERGYHYCKNHQLELSFTSPGWISETKLKEMRMVVPSCGASLSNMAIAPNGEVIPCQSWLFEEGLGNILEEKWKDIWNHPCAIKQREFSAKSTQTCQLRSVK